MTIYQNRILSVLVTVFMLHALMPETYAQESGYSTRSVSLQEAVSLAAEQSFLTRKANADQQIARAEVVMSRSAFLPQISVSNTAYSTTDPLNVFGFKLKQQSVVASDFAPAVLNNPDRIDHFSTRLEIQQPLINPEGIFKRRVARNRLQVASYSEKRARFTVSFMVRKAYFGLVLARRRHAVMDSSLTVAESNRDQVQSLFDEGLINRADLLEVRVHVLNAKTQLNEAINSVKNASDQLRYLLGIREPVELIPTDALKPSLYRVGPVDFDRINQDRSDMRALEFQREAARQELNAGKTGMLPNLSFFGSYELNDDNVFGSQGTNWGVGAVLRWNLFSGFQRAGGIERARAQLLTSELRVRDQSTRNQIEIDETLRAITTSEERVELERAAVAHARENLRIRTDRYSEGLEKTTDVLEAEVLLSQKRLALLDALFNHQITLFKLEYLTESPLSEKP